MLIKDSTLISPDDLECLSNHFRSKIEHELLKAEETGIEINYTELVKNVMDFRNWFEFKMHYFEKSINNSVYANADLKEVPGLHGSKFKM